jgi:hypothetical protein
VQKMCHSERSEESRLNCSGVSATPRFLLRRNDTSFARRFRLRATTTGYRRRTVTTCL